MLKVSRDCSELSAGHGGEVGQTKTTREPKKLTAKACENRPKRLKKKVHSFQSTSVYFRGELLVLGSFCHPKQVRKPREDEN